MALLDDRFSDIDKLLAKKLQEARGSTDHRGVRGNELGGALGQIIAERLIESSAFCEQCEVTDTHGTRSKEVDLVFLNRFHPRFLLEDRPRAFLIEGVTAAAEVKTSLDKRSTTDCLEKARAFKRLLAAVDGKDLEVHNVEAKDWPRFLIRRSFFAFAYEDTRPLAVVLQNIEEWIRLNQVPEVEQVDAFFVLNKGVIVNLGSGLGVMEMRDVDDHLLDGFVMCETPAVFSQLMLWLSLVCPTFASLRPILLRYATFSMVGYIKP